MGVTVRQEGEMGQHLVAVDGLLHGANTKPAETDRNIPESTLMDTTGASHVWQESHFFEMHDTKTRSTNNLQCPKALGLFVAFNARTR